MQFEDVLVLIIAALTTILVVGAGPRLFGMPVGRMMDAAKGLMECVGAFLAFLAFNVAVGLLLVFSIRIVTRRFVSLYSIESAMLVVLSAIQGIGFVLWRGPGRDK